MFVSTLPNMLCKQIIDSANSSCWVIYHLLLIVACPLLCQVVGYYLIFIDSILLVMVSFLMGSTLLVDVNIFEQEGGDS